MSKRINVNPDRYKVAGRERQGEDVVHRVEKQEITRLRHEERGPAGERQRTGPQGRSHTAAQSGARATQTGISNRQPAEVEARRREPRRSAVDASSPPPEDAAGGRGEQPLEDLRDRHTSHKAGSRSIAQKEAGARYPDRSMPASRKVSGAFGREPRTGPAGETPPRRRRRR
ncbi:MAG: hypothetical protein GEV06_27465 [Luteitalea sp.]|nr:hypothetical protein [Luteitalea sp.]